MNASLLLALALVAVGSYLLGSIQCGLLIARGFGVQDIRKAGSGGSGATNVMRIAGKVPSILTFVCDFLKGFIPAMAGKLIIGAIYAPWAVYGAFVGGFCAALGHVWPLYFGFRGGKGVSTLLGAVGAIAPWVCLVIFAGSVTLIILFRIVSVVSLSMAFLAAAGMAWSTGFDPVCCVFCALYYALLVFTHRQNIKRLLKGEEKRISFHK